MCCNTLTSHRVNKQCASWGVRTSEFLQSHIAPHPLDLFGEVSDASLCHKLRNRLKKQYDKLIRLTIKYKIPNYVYGKNSEASALGDPSYYVMKTNCIAMLSLTLSKSSFFMKKYEQIILIFPDGPLAAQE